MNFNQWRNYAAKGEVAKITYCCGDQDVLIELVVEDIKNILQVPATDFISIDARKDNSFWEEASKYSLDPDASRLTVVRYAEAITDWSGLDDWLSNMKMNTKNFILFVSYEADAPSIFVRGKRTGYLSHIELIRAKGKFIKCSTPNDEDLIKWAEGYGLSQNSAEYLIDRTSGDVSTMLDVFRKVHVWNGSPTPKALALLCDELALDSFADYLILKDKASAHRSLSNMSVEEYSKVLTKLSYRLDSLVEINRCVRKRMYDGDIAASTGIKIYIVKKLRPVAKDYDDRKIKYYHQLLAMIDGLLRDGATVGVLETLITLW